MASGREVEASPFPNSPEGVTPRTLQAQGHAGFQDCRRQEAEQAVVLPAEEKDGCYHDLPGDIVGVHAHLHLPCVPVHAPARGQGWQGQTGLDTSWVAEWLAQSLSQV